MVNIPALTQDQQAEGLTLQLVNSKSFLKIYSPVILTEGAQPIKLLECAKGFWVIQENGDFLRTGDSLLVIPVKDAQIGRARYMFKFGDQQKLDKIQTMVKRWMRDIKHKLSDYCPLTGRKYRIQRMKDIGLLNDDIGYAKEEDFLLLLQKDNKLAELLYIFGIIQTKPADINPDTCEGDILSAAALIEVEKLYTW